MSACLLEPLNRVLELMAEAPNSAAALTLYALASTLEHERTGCLFRLVKLRDLEADQRLIAYGLMEASVGGEVETPAWREAKAQMDRLIRAGVR
jgi:hypothetical protein